jgi:hypothetical protein
MGPVTDKERWTMHVKDAGERALHSVQSSRTDAPLRMQRCVRSSLAAVSLLAMFWGAASAASGFAMIEAPPTRAAGAGLPDGRVYEQVSPTNKNGNEAGSGTAPFKTGAEDHYGYASSSGEALLFEGTGPMGESPWANSVFFVATKTNGRPGWSTRALQPRGVESLALLNTKLNVYLEPSQDLSHAMIEPNHDPVAQRPNEECGAQVFLIGPDPFIPGTWLERPSPELADPIEGCGDHGGSGAPVGGSPDFSTVYFTYAGTLLPEDAARTAYAGEAWGFYEYKGGVLAEAGVLPNGTVSQFGAVPAASSHGRNPSGDQVSDDGTRAFFVSPDPNSCDESGGRNNCATDPPELYVRIDGKSTLLASMDTLLPQEEGAPVGAPSSVLPMPNRHIQLLSSTGEYVFASPDGSQAFFQSEDALTRPAEQQSPGREPKTYDFDVNTDTIEYLPGVLGEILATDGNGSSVAFLRPEGGGQPPQLDLWTAGANGGTVTPVVQLSESDSIPETRMSDDGSVLVFQTAETIAGFNNRGTHEREAGRPEAGSEEIYRYNVPANTLGCVSCPPVGVTPRGNSTLSMLHNNEGEYLGIEFNPSLADERGISADGKQIFFESSDPLVPGDSNTNSPPALLNEEVVQPQGRDVYEWENGIVYLLSTGTSSRNSYLLDSSESGDDVFFATTQSLVPGDTDGGYDVYDARVPRPGESTAQSSSSCEGSTCQGPARAFELPAAPTSAGVTGAGNPVAETAPPSPPTKAKPKAAKCRRGYLKRKGRCVKTKSRTARKARG